MADALDTAIELYTSGDLAGAEKIYRQLIETDPADVDAHCHLAELLRTSNRLEEAVQHFQIALKFDPAYAEGHCLLGATLRQMGKNSDAIKELAIAVRLKPDLAEAHFELASIESAQGQRTGAIATLQKALQIKPDHPRGWCQLGNLLSSDFRWDDAASAYRQALAHQPAYAEAQHNLGVALHKSKLLDPAAEAFRAAAALDPKSAETLLDLGLVLTDAARMEEAVDVFKQAVALKPSDPYIGSCLCYAVHFHSGYDPRAILDEHLRWASRHAEPLQQSMPPPTNDRSPDRRLRIGFVSPDFRSHAIARFVLPVYESRSRDALEFFSYASVLNPDVMTDRFRDLSDQWRSVAAMNDDQLAQLVRDDRIDILIDLTMHLRGSRLLAFARKPAPVQATYMAYCSTTGISAMDYRISDPYLDPIGADESVYTEKTARLPRTYWCYQAWPTSPAVNARHNGPVIFGNLNNFNKVTAQTLAMWAQVLQETPNSQMLIHALPGSHRQRVLEHFATAGVEKTRIRFSDRVPMNQYLQIYHEIDIALDSFPHGGGTTTCDALWMGVPVITRRGGTAVSRYGSSILSNLGLGEFVASSADEYVSIAATLAADRPRLATLRATLRQRLRNSAVMDEAAFARDFEQALRTMWREYCGQHSQT